MDFDEEWTNIMKAIDEVVHTVKPQKILFLAVDGVAPRKDESAESPPLPRSQGLHDDEGAASGAGQGGPGPL